MSYALNQESAAAARKSEQRTSFIDEKGKYGGQFTKAEDILANSGTRGVAFSFKSHDGQISDFTIYTVKEDGTQLGDYGLLMAVMTCLGVRDIKPTKVKGTVWDKAANARVEKVMTQFPELLNKDIGILLAMEEQERSDGAGTFWKTRLNAVYREADELTASEILDRKTQPQKLALLVAALKDKPLKGKKPQGAAAGAKQYAGQHSDSNGGFDDEIPFAPAYARAAWSLI